MAVFTPLAFLKGNTGRLFNEFGIAVAGSVVISGFVALTLTPDALRQDPPGAEEPRPVYQALERGFDWLADHLRRHARLGGAPALGHHRRRGRRRWCWRRVIFKALKREFVPPEDRGFFMAVITGPRAPRCSTPTATRSRWRRSWPATPEIKSYFSVVGMGGDVSRGFVFVN